MADRLEQVLPATADHARDLAPRLRPADVAEVLASHGLDPLAALVASIEVSTEAWALLFDGKVVALYGVAPDGPDDWSVWLLASDDLGRRPRDFLVRARAAIAGFLTRYPLLSNHVDARYEPALRFAEHLGFAVGPPTPYGVAGLPFCRIERRS